MKLFRLVSAFITITCAVALNLITTSASAADEFFYSGGKKHPLVPETEWIAVEVTDASEFDAAERELKGNNIAPADGQSIRHDKAKILVTRLSDAPAARQNTKEKLAKIKGHKRTPRLFKNGKHEPVVETDEFIIRFKNDVLRADIDRLLQVRGAEIIRPLGNFSPNGFVARVLDPVAVPVTDVANALYTQPGVLYSHPNFIWPKVQRFVPNDTIYNQQWHLNNDGSNGGIVGADVKAERAWDITRGDPNCLIAILDDGVDLDHEDFASSGKLINHWDFVGNDNNPRPGSGQHHGTSCAGLAAADGNNSKGVSGVAPNCRIMGVRMLGPNHTWEREAAAISHAKNNGAWIISNSWGPTDGTGESFPCPDVVNDAIVDATDNGRSGKGCVITWAAGNGNESSDLDGYASHPRVICVAATMRNDITSPYSDFGDGVDVCAPGGSSQGDMVTTDRMGSVGYSSTNYTVGFNGTSAATPVVSGVAALLLSAEPNLTWQQVRQRLINSADFVDLANVTYDENGHHPWYGFGRVNAWAALTWNDSDAPSLNITFPTNNTVTTTLNSASGSASDVGVGLLRVEARLKNQSTGQWWNWSLGFWTDGSAPETTTNAVLSGGNWSVALPNLNQGTFEIHARAEDKSGYFSGWQTRVYILDNSAPSVSISSPSAGQNYSSLASASGAATDVAAGITQVRVALFGQNNGLWWNWDANTWGNATFSFANNVRVATGTTSWSVALPSVAEGNYQLHAQSVDGSGKASDWANVAYILDSANPTIGFAPLTNQTEVFNFQNLGGTVSETGTVKFRIIEYNVGGIDRYWNGSTWINNVADVSTWRPAALNGLTWFPAEALPRRGQTRWGHYIIEAKITDRAGKEATSNLVLIRSQQDTTVPDGSITSPAAGQIFTNNFLPNFYGNASDGESGVADVTLYLMRTTASGFEYWNGRGWSPNTEALPAQVNFDNWQAPVTGGTGGYSLPSGSNLRNGNYQLQVSIRNKEEPSGTRGLSVSFTVDYHPVYTWTAGSFYDSDQNNNNHNWDNPENWSPYGVPPAEAIAVISSGEPTAASVGNLNIYGINLSGGTLAYSNLFARKLNVTGGSLLGGSLNLEATNGVFNWSAGYLRGNATFLKGSTVNLLTGGTKELASFALVQNHGTVNWLGTGYIYTYAYSAGDISRFYNMSNAVFNVLTNGTVFNNAYNPSYFYNEPGALFTKTAGDGTNWINNFHFYNRGEMRCDNGSLNFNGDAFAEDGSIFSGSGTFKLEGSRLEFRGTTTIRGAMFDFNSGNVVGSTNNWLVTTNGGLIDWRGGYLHGLVRLSTGSQMRFSSSNTKELVSFARLKNYGNITWADTGAIYTYSYSAGDYSSIENMPGATFQVTGNANCTYAYNASYFTNHAGATFRKTSGGGTTRMDWFFNNDGDFDCQSGEVVLGVGGASSGNFLTTANGVIRYDGGTHTWNGVDLEGAGKVSVHGGTVNRNGGVHGGATGATLEVRTGTLGGTGPFTGDLLINWLGGTMAGQIDVAPTVTIDASGSDAKTLGSSATFNNGGTFHWSGPGRLYTYAYNSGDVSRFNNLSNAVFNLRTDGELFDIAYNVSHFTNHAGGLVVKSGGGGTNNIDDFTFHNFGEMRVDTGTLRFIYLLRLNQGSTLTGNGTVRLAGDAQLDTVLPSTATIVLESGTLNNTTNAAYNGTVPFIWNGGAIAGHFTLQQSRVMNLTGNDTKQLASFARFHNHGNVNWTGPGRIYTYAYSAGDASVFNNYSNATFNVLTDGQVFEMAYNVSFFTNHAGALFAKTSSAGTNHINSFHLHNYGEIRPAQGTLLFNDVLRLNHGSRLIGAGTVRFAGNVTFDGTLTANCSVGLDAGTLTGVVLSNRPPAYTGTGLFSWQAGTLAGRFDLQSGSTMHLFGNDAKSVNALAVLNNHGVMNWSGPGRIYTFAYNGGDRSILNNYATFNVLNDGDLFASDYNPSFFTNHVSGRFVKTSGTNDILMNDWIFANRGEIKAQSGVVNFQFSLQIENGSRFTGPGLIHLSAGDAYLRGALELDAGATFRVNSTLHNELPIMPSVVTKSGTTFEWMGGQFNGTFTLPAGSTLTMSGGTRSFGNNAVFNNRGTINWTGGNIYKYAYNAGDRCTFKNESGGQFNMLGNAAFTFDYNASVFTNAVGGIVRKLNSTGTTTSDWIFDNAGTLEVQSGMLNLPTAPTLYASSSVLFPVAGTNSGTNFGRLNLPNNMALNGSLMLSLSNNFAPVDGASFTVANYGSRAENSQFSPVTLPTLPYPLQWKTTYGAAALVFSVQRAHLLTPAASAPENGEFDLAFSGPAATSAILQTSTNLTDWKSVVTNAPFTGTFNFTDFQATVSNKFYRVLIEP